MWFKTLTGFTEQSPAQVRDNITANGRTLISHANGKTMTCGHLAMPTLAELRTQVATLPTHPGPNTVREIVADVQQLHTDPANAGALFQVASQFNLLEMTSPGITPEQGIDIYEHDHTQGPACAIAAGAGTIYRNYFVPVNGRLGQTADNQIDCLADIGTALDNTNGRLWQMRNGYPLAGRVGLEEIAQRLHTADDATRDALRGRLRIGIQWHTQVTLDECTHTVSQAYCSALPVAYSSQPADLWEPFARLILEAAYEATLCTAVINFADKGSNKLFLTLLGGGAFGNRIAWIMDALHRALTQHPQAGLDIALVSYGASNPAVQTFITGMDT